MTMTTHTTMQVIAPRTNTFDGTGAASRARPAHHQVRVVVGEFVVTVSLSDSNEFLAVIDVSKSEDFRTLTQKLASLDVHDVDDFYKESE